jgi:UDP:flavonoid glycosyltransferase YjiC (YdhE family)
VQLAAAELDDEVALGDAIRQAATDAGMRQRAREMSAKIRAEDGVGEVVGLIEGWL